MKVRMVWFQTHISYPRWWIIMAGSWKQIAIITAFVFIFAVHPQNSKLNVPRVLLPLFKEFCTNFTLEVSDPACYKWCVFICKVMWGNNLSVVMYLMYETYSWIIYISWNTETIVEVTFFTAVPFVNSQPTGGFVEATCFATLRLYWNKMECNYTMGLESVMFYCDIC